MVEISWVVAISKSLKSYFDTAGMKAVTNSALITSVRRGIFNCKLYFITNCYQFWKNLSEKTLSFFAKV